MTLLLAAGSRPRAASQGCGRRTRGRDGRHDAVLVLEVADREERLEDARLRDERDAWRGPAPRTIAPVPHHARRRAPPSPIEPYQARPHHAPPSPAPRAVASAPRPSVARDKAPRASVARERRTHTRQVPAHESAQARTVLIRDVVLLAALVHHLRAARARSAQAPAARGALSRLRPAAARAAACAPAAARGPAARRARQAARRWAAPCSARQGCDRTPSAAGTTGAWPRRTESTSPGSAVACCHWQSARL